MGSVTVEAVKDYDDGLIESHENLEKSAFPEHMVYVEGADYCRACLKDAANINVVMRDGSGKIIGYVVAVPQRNVHEELRKYAPDMKDDPERFYVDTIQTLPGTRRAFGILKLLYARIEEAWRRCVGKFSMHARKTNGLSRIILRVFPKTICLRTVDNWYNYGEPFDYIEGTPERRDRSVSR